MRRSTSPSSASCSCARTTASSSRQDIQVFYVSPPALNDINRWIEDQMRVLAQQAAQQAQQPAEQPTNEDPSESPEEDQP